MTFSRRGPLHAWCVSLLLILLQMFGFLAPQASAVPVLEVYETYWPAEKLLPVIKPELGPADTMQVFRNKLVIRAEQDTHQRIAELLEAVDRAPRNLLISLRKASGQASHRQTRVFRGSSDGDGIETVMMSENTLSTHQDASLQQVRVLEGEEARISIGEETPIQEVRTDLDGLQATTRYRPTARYLYVTPQITRKGIRLAMSTRSTKTGNTAQQVDTDGLDTVIIAEEGFWTPVGGSSSDAGSPDGSVTWTTRGMQDRSAHYEVKVDVLP